LTPNTTRDALGPDAIALEPWAPTFDPPPFDGGLEMHWVGDCREAGLLDGAMLDAARVARSL
jgi:hypothetical protein